MAVGRNISVNSSSKYLVAAMLGVVHSWYTVAFWGWYVANHPINNLLLEVFVKQGHSALCYFSIYAHDALLNVILAMPIAVALLLIRNLDNCACLMVAATMSVAISFWGTELTLIPTLFRIWTFWAGLSLSLLSLPIAFATVRAVRKHQTLL